MSESRNLYRLTFYILSVVLVAEVVLQYVQSPLYRMIIALLLYLIYFVLNRQNGIVLVSNGVIHSDILDKNHISTAYLQEKAQSLGVPSMDAVGSAILLPSGRVDITIKPDVTPMLFDPATSLPLYDISTNTGDRVVFRLDIHGIQSINEKHGFESGSSAMRMISEVLVNRLRDNDCVYRGNLNTFVVAIDAAEHVAIMVIKDILARIGSLSDRDYSYITNEGLSFTYEVIQDQ